MTVWLIVAATVLYAAYNVMFKLAGTAIPATATSTVLGTITLQLAALTASLIFLSYQAVSGEHSFRLSGSSYFWAAMGGLCIGTAEIVYLYLFGGLGGAKPAEASTAIPIIVGGTVVLSAVFAAMFLSEKLTLVNVAGIGLVIAGLFMAVYGKV